MNNRYPMLRQMRQSLFLATILVMASISAIAQPTITSFSPAGGPAGTLMTITGTNLSGATAVSINGTSALVISSSSTTAVGLVMPGTTTGTVSVTTSGTATSTDKFNVFAPTAVPAPGNSQFKLIGTGITGTTIQQGWSVALSADGNTAIVGGNKDNSSVGAVWVYTRSGTSWTQQNKLVGTGYLGTTPQLGYSVAVSADGSTIIAGGYADGAAGSNKGAVWIFTRVGSSWTTTPTQVKIVGPGASAASSYQGNSVAISADGKTVAWGGQGDATNVGAVWVYAWNGTSWSQQGPSSGPAKLVGTGYAGTTPRQGWSVALSADGNTLVEGGRQDGATPTTGAIWVYTRSGGVWTQQGTKIVGTGNTGGAYQGTSIAISADGNKFIEGGYANNSLVGAAWVFTRSGSTWSQQAMLLGTGNTGAANTGNSVGMSADGNTVIMGGPHDNSYVGATWIYTYNGTTWALQGSKFHGTPYSGIAGSVPQFGNAAALSADGQTAIIGGYQDGYASANTGAAWAFVVATPSVNIAITSGSQTTCSGSSVTFTATPTNGGAAAPKYNFMVNGVSVQSGSSATYTTTSLNNNDVVKCIITDNDVYGYSAVSNSITMTVNPLPTAGITGTSTACGSVSLTATGGTSYAWSGGSTPATANNTFTSSATYIVTVTDANSCTATASQAVTVNTVPTAGITGTATGCGSVSLTATGGSTYLWSGGSSTATAANTFTTSGVYNVTVSNSSCSATASQSVSVTPSPTATITGTAIGCGSVSLTATGGGTYAWSGGSSPTTDANTFSSSATYTVTVTLSGCTATASQAVTVNPVPAATASNTGPYIPGQTISLSSGPAGQTSYSWAGPHSFTASTQNTTRTAATSAMSGTYTVTVTNSYGCSATATTFVAVNSLGDYTWTGAAGTAWTTTTNWSPTAPAGGPNGCTQNVIIPDGSVYPVISSAVSIGNVTINENAQVTLNANFSICGNLVGGVSTPANILGNANLILNGATAQSVSGIITLNTLVINNTSTGITSTGTIVVNKSMVMTAGAFRNYVGTIKLVSTASGDAYFDNFNSGTAGPFSGSITVQKYMSNTADGYRDLSAPVLASVANLNSSYPVTGLNHVDCWYSYSPYPNLQVFDEGLVIPSANGAFNEHWLSFTTLSYALSPMLGLAFRTYVGSPYTINFTGSPYNGSYSTIITHTNTAIPANDGWNLIGNPYASPIKWSMVKAMNVAVAAGSYYVYHTTGEYTGSWGSYNGTTGVNGATDDISIAQGFWVQTAASTSFTMNNSVRTTTPGTYYGARHALDNEVRLVLNNATNSDEIVTYTDVQGHTDLNPELDAVKMPAGSAVSIGFSMSGNEYAIKVLNAITDQTELPLTILVNESGTYTLSAATLNVHGLPVYLKDAQTNTLTNLADGPIQLTLNANKTYSGRYSVVFRSNNVSGISNVGTHATQIYSFGNRVYVKRSSTDPATISVTNLIGQDVSEINTVSEETDFELQAIQPWYAIVKVTEGDKVSVAKVLISNK